MFKNKINIMYYLLHHTYQGQSMNSNQYITYNISKGWSNVCNLVIGPLIRTNENITCFEYI